MSARGRAVASTSAEAREAASAAMSEGGNAFDAAVAGFFAAAGAHPAALLSPLVLALAGVGQRPTFFDGRSREPGLGVVRPARHRDARSAPALARLAVPAAPVAVAVAVAASGSRRLAQLAAFGVKAARRERAPERARAIEAVGRAGGLALQERWFLQELAERAPRIEGALVGPDDIAQVRPGVETLEAPEALGGTFVYRPAWSAGLAGGEGAPAARERRVLVAVDGRGALAAALWYECEGGLPLFEGQLALPAIATPIVSGVTRVRPGTPVATPAPLAFAGKGEGRVEAALGTNAGELSAAMAEAVKAAGTGLWPAADAPSPFGAGVELVAALSFEAGREGAARHWRAHEAPPA
jgi:hypothetical protein